MLPYIPKPERLRILLERIKKRSSNVDNCIVFNGARTEKGYGVITIDEKGERAYIHQLIYAIKHNDFSDGFILHTCDNPACWNPDHLYKGTAKDNSKDMSVKRRGRKTKEFYNCIPLSVEPI